jgi:hypothetical protein
MHCSPPLWWAVGYRVLKFGPRISLTAGLQRHPSGWPEPRFQAEQPLGSRIRFSRRQAKAARSIASAVGGLERKKMLRGVFCGRLLNAPYHSSGRPEKRQRGTWSYGCLVRGGIFGRWCRSLGGLGSRSRADITKADRSGIQPFSRDNQHVGQAGRWFGIQHLGGVAMRQSDRRLGMRLFRVPGTGWFEGPRPCNPSLPVKSPPSSALATCNGFLPPLQVQLQPQNWATAPASPKTPLTDPSLVSRACICTNSLHCQGQAVRD